MIGRTDRKDISVESGINKACDKVSEQHRKAVGNLREIKAGIAVLNSLKAVEDERSVGSFDAWVSGSEEECSSYAPPPYGTSRLDIGELRHQVRLLIGFLQSLEQELEAADAITDPTRKPTLGDYIKQSGFVPNESL